MPNAKYAISKLACPESHKVASTSATSSSPPPPRVDITGPCCEYGARNFPLLAAILENGETDEGKKARAMFTCYLSLSRGTKNPGMARTPGLCTSLIPAVRQAIESAGWCERGSILHDAAERTERRKRVMNASEKRAAAPPVVRPSGRNDDAHDALSTANPPLPRALRRGQRRNVLQTARQSHFSGCGRADGGASLRQIGFHLVTNCRHETY